MPPEGNGNDSEQRKRGGQAPWLRFTGAGVELAASTLLLGAIGVALDRQFHAKIPIYSAALGGLGFVFGMIRFIRLANAISKQVDADRTSDKRTNHQGQGDEDRHAR